MKTIRYKLKKVCRLNEQREVMITKEKVIDMYKQLEDEQISGFIFGLEETK